MDTTTDTGIEQTAAQMKAVAATRALAAQDKKGRRARNAEPVDTGMPPTHYALRKRGRPPGVAQCGQAVSALSRHLTAHLLTAAIRDQARKTKALTRALKAIGG